jgi:hypothetical protein
MEVRMPSRFAFLLSLLLALLPAASAQTVSGQIAGRLLDPTGAVIVGAKVQLTNDLTQQVREFTTDSSGNFVFTNLVPGNYSIRIVKSGFKAYDQKGITVSAVERVDLHDLRLEIGEVTTTVQVQAEEVHLATDSSDRSVSVTLKQIQDTVTRGRDFMALMSTLPGVQDLNSYDTRGWGTGSPTLLGGQTGQKLLTIDGAAAQDSGNRDFGYIAPSVDAIAEVKVLMANYDAEYGARSGGQMNVLIKGGTNEFHGTGYFYFRNEALNANEFFNNKLGIRRPLYRHQNPGGTIGGPLIIPGTSFNRSHNRLFWFFSYDYLHSTGVTGANRYTMPTALERQGDFSETRTTTGVLIPIRDYTTGKPFPNNRIPASRFDRAGAAFLNLFPLPNTTDPTGQRQYNAQFVNSFAQPRTDKILRVDYPISSRTTSYVRLLQEYTGNDGYGQILGALGDGWRQFPHGYDIPSAGVVAALIHTFRPNLVSETSWGINRGHQTNHPTDDALYADSLLPLKDSGGNTIPLPRIFPSNYLNLRPNINFGFPSSISPQSGGQGVPNAPQYGFDSRWPFDGTDQLQTISSNLSWVKGSHNVKLGFYLERMARNVSIYSTYNIAGTYYFGSDTASPVDTNYPYSNLLLGSFFAYGEDNLKQTNHARYTQEDWFVQDTWRVHPRFTVNVGVRFQRLGALHTVGQTLGLFSPTAYDPGKAGQLLYPALVDGQKVSINPATGAIYPYVRQGTFDPASYASTGTPFTGIAQYTGSYWNTPPVALGPRAGFAWDIFGNGKMALRGGFGIFHDRAQTVDYIGALGVGTGPQAAPPHFLAPIILNSTISSLSGAPVLYTPQNIQGGPRDFVPPSSYNWSFGVQRDLGRGLTLDVAYVGNVFHHGYNWNTDDLNAVPPFTTWTPSGGTNKAFVDPTSSSGALYSTNLIRSLVGYKGIAQIPLYTSIGASNYNSLQVQFNRRVGRNLQFSTNYTWSKTLLYSHQQFTDDALTKNVTGNRPHAFNANFGYSLPKGSSLWRSALSKQALDNWRLTGTAAIYSRSAMNITCNYTNNPVGWPNGTPTGGVLFRCQMVNPTMSAVWLPAGASPASVGSSADPRLWFPFNASNFVLPTVSSTFTRGMIGNEPPTLTYGPGVEIFNLALLKEFAVTESRRLEFRLEAINAFNHFNPSNPNTTLTLNYVTGANTNAAFGTIQGSQYNNRRAIVSVRFSF